MTQDPQKTILIAAEKYGLVGDFFRIRSGPEGVTAEQRGDRHRGQPAQGERDQQDLEKRSAEFPSAVIGKPDRGKGGHGDHGRAEQRQLCLCRNFPRRLQLVLSAADPDHHPFGDDDGVVHQHSQCNDQGSQRDPLQRDAEIIHQHQRSGNGQQQDGSDDQTGFQPHEKKQNRDHDQYRFNQIHRKGRDRLSDRFRL